MLTWDPCETAESSQVLGEDKWEAVAQAALQASSRRLLLLLFASQEVWELCRPLDTVDVF